MRIILFTLLCGLLIAQQPAAPPKTQPPADALAPAPTADAPLSFDPEFRISTTVEEVQVPVWVMDKDGAYINNVHAEEFHLYDNDKDQNIKVDVTYTPVSLVLAIQANSQAQALLPQVNKIGNLIGPQVIGDAGETAVIAYDHRITVLQEFTNDPSKIKDAVAKIKPGSTSSRMVDAVVAAARMLRSRPKDRRRVLLLIGETRDVGSESRVREALMDLQLTNILFYSVDMSRFINVLTNPRQPARPSTLPPAATFPVGARGVATPTSMEQMTNVNANVQFIPLMVELFRDAKAIFVANPVEAFTRGTGGVEFGFHSQRTLEDALGQLGEQLHSMYTLSYTPASREEGGFHTIRVTVGNHANVGKVINRPGYWIGPKQ
jgi:VWFA-related protein